MTAWYQNYLNVDRTTFSTSIKTEISRLENSIGNNCIHSVYLKYEALIEKEYVLVCTKKYITIYYSCNSGQGLKK